MQRQPGLFGASEDAGPDDPFVEHPEVHPVVLQVSVGRVALSILRNDSGNVPGSVRLPDSFRCRQSEVLGTAFVKDPACWLKQANVSLRILDVLALPNAGLESPTTNTPAVAAATKASLISRTLAARRDSARPRRQPAGRPVPRALGSGRAQITKLEAELVSTQEMRVTQPRGTPIPIPLGPV
jgi:hypothetical protein